MPLGCVCAVSVLGVGVLSLCSVSALGVCAGSLPAGSAGFSQSDQEPSVFASVFSLVRQPAAFPFGVAGAIAVSLAIRGLALVSHPQSSDLSDS